MQGVIRDSQGRGIPGVQLDLQGSHGTGSGQHYSATTNVEGIFRLRDVRLGVYEVKLTREGFEAQTISSFQIIHPVSVLELVLKDAPVKRSQRPSARPVCRDALRCGADRPSESLSRTEKPRF